MALWGEELIKVSGSSGAEIFTGKGSSRKEGSNFCNGSLKGLARQKATSMP